MVKEPYRVLRLVFVSVRLFPTPIVLELCAKLKFKDCAGSD